MSRPLAIVAILIAFGVGIAVGVLGILWATGGNATPSQDVADRVPTLSLDADTPTPSADLALGTEIALLNGKIDILSTQMSDSDTEISQQIGAVEEAVNEIDPEALAQVMRLTPVDSIDVTLAPTDVATEAPTTTMPPPTEEPEAEAQGSDDVPERGLYRITQEESEARFLIDETLIGNPTTVVGTTNRIAGDVIVNFADPPASQIGTISVNARTLKTDNEFRDQSIRGQILQSSRDEFEFIDFVPTELVTLTTEPVGVGETIDFQIIGDITIKGVTNQATFETQVTVAAEDRIEGFATATVLYEDFEINIQAPPNVTDIGDEVTLEFDFVALLVEE